MFDVKAKNPRRKQRRFQRPEFKQKLERARKFSRKAPTRPENVSGKVLHRLGFKSRATRIALILFFIILLYYLALSSFFLVEAATVKGSGIESYQIEEVLQRLQRKRTFLIPQNHIILLNKENFAQALKAELPNVRQVTSYKRVLPDTVAVSVEMREQKYIWETRGEYFFMDQEGVIFQQVLNYDPAIFSQILISDTTSQPVVEGEELDIGKALRFLRELETNWDSIVRGAQYSGVTLPGTASVDIIAKTEQGFEVLFDLNRGAVGQLQNLQLLLSQEINPETLSGLKYIDLRLSEVGYYCYRDADCAGERELQSE